MPDKTGFAPKEKTDKPLCGINIAPPQAVIDIRTAFFAEKEEIATENATGRIAAGIVTPCPPGVPVVMPGEKLDAEACAEIIKSGIFKIDVVK